MKRPYTILLILLGAIALLVLTIVANISRSHSTVSGIEVSLRCGDTPQLVDEQAVIDSVLAAIPALLATRVQDVDRRAVADAAARVPYLRDVSATVSVSGKVVVRAVQCTPIVRLFYGSREYYVDADFRFMPPGSRGFCDVLVASGQFTEPLCTDSLNLQLSSLLTLARWLYDHPKYSCLIDQIYSLPNADIILVPKLGNHTIELGSATDLDDKFSRLLLFYLKGMPRAGWHTYSKINLKFNHQVVCTKESNNR
ncbi:MAG: hypothetical protein IJU19_04770 [Bacteroidales bacterium]|nr:hypothetical protein [Bacteroidales bacterium]